MRYESGKGILSGSVLKIIAVLSMLVDHSAAVLVDRSVYPDIYTCMRTFGRLAFPIFCFLLVEGYIHTRNIKKYIIRLGIFALISEVPFDMAILGANGIELTHQNVFFTLFLGLLMVWCIEWCIEHYKNNQLLQIIVVILFAVAAYFLKTDYMYYGIIQIAFFYYMHNMQLYRIFSIILINLYMNQPFGALALLLTEAYNGKRGINIKYLIYVFYPLHLIILYLIKECIIN